MTSRRPAHSLPGSFVKEKRSPFKPSFKGVGDALENISSGDEASFTKGHDDEPRRVPHSFCTRRNFLHPSLPPPQLYTARVSFIVGCLQLLEA